MDFIDITKHIKNESWSMVDLHSHAHYEIYFLTKGNRIFFLSNKLYKLSAPSVVIIPPYTMHKTEGDAFERINIMVSPSYLDEFQKHILDSKALKIIALSANAKNEIFKIIEKMYSLDRNTKYSGRITHSLFAYLAILISELDNDSLAPVASIKKDVPDIVLKVIDYLNGHYSDKITLDKLAKEFFISKGTLIYNFNKYLGCSPIDYLLNVRLTKAKQMLSYSDVSISEISEKCGFSSPNYFGLIFKQKENMSPINYRKIRK